MRESQVFGNYLLTDILGSGARGKVYRAEDRRSGETVALKLLLEQTDGEQLKRFKREAEVLKKLVHSNIVAIREYGYEDLHPFIAMDLVPGESLDQIVKKQGPLADATAHSVFVQCAQALKHAHSTGILHRDIKPSNIMLTPDPVSGYRVLLVDFGLAKRLTSDASRSGSTRTGEFVGTPQYMSPEQFMDTALDERTDIFSLGCVMYEAITGKQCCEATVLFECMHQQMNAMPPHFAEIDPPVTSVLEGIIFKCLSKKRNKRFGSAIELLAALEASSATATPRVRNWWRSLMTRLSR